MSRREDVDVAGDDIDKGGLLNAPLSLRRGTTKTLTVASAFDSTTCVSYADQVYIIARAEAMVKHHHRDMPMD
jgi:hypothetical protein